MQLRLNQAFQNKEISIRLRRPINGKASLHGTCRQLLASGIILNSGADLDQFISRENIDLYWLDQKGLP